MTGCCDDDCTAVALRESQRGTLYAVLAINTIMFFVIVIAAQFASSTALFADSLDNLGDALTYADEIATRRPRGEDALAVMDQHLADHPYFVGDTYSIADIALYSYTAHAPEGNVSLADYPNIRAWLERIEALPGFIPMANTAIGLAA